MGGLRGGASAQGPGGPADAPGLNVRRDVQGRRRRRRAAEADGIWGCGFRPNVSGNVKRNLRTG